MPSDSFIQNRYKSVYWTCCAYFKLLVVSIKLRYMGMSWLQKQVDFNNISDNALGRRVTDPKLLAMHEAVRFAARWHFLTLNCLPRSLVLVDMLRGLGMVAVVCIGVAKKSDALLSHAWVEVTVNDMQELIGEPESVEMDFKRL